MNRSFKYLSNVVLLQKKSTVTTFRKSLLLVMEQHSNDINIHKTIICCYDCTIVVYCSGDNMSVSLATTQYRTAISHRHFPTPQNITLSYTQYSKAISCM